MVSAIHLKALASGYHARSEDVSLTKHQVSKQFMSDPMTSFALPDTLRVRRIRHPPQLDPLTDDMIPVEKKEYLGLGTTSLYLFFICPPFLHS